MNRNSFFQSARAALVLSASALAVSGVMAQSTLSESTAAKAASFAALKASVRSGAALNPNALGSFSSDLVYTPVTPCRIVDTRNAVGPFLGGQARTYDFDGTSGAATTYAQQGGVAASCNVPYGTATAAALNLTVTGTGGVGYLTAWGLGTQPNASVLNWAAGDTLANTTIVPIAPGIGNDFTIFASGGTHVIIDVVGYYAAPTGTAPALDCTQVATPLTTVAHNVWTNVTASCAAGYFATGGGGNTAEGTLGRPQIWFDSVAGSTSWTTWVDNQTGSSRQVQTYVTCCRVIGR
jgi:hypothetical protein